MRTLVFDSAPLSSFARALRLPLLDQLSNSYERVTTQAVLDELRVGLPNYPELSHALELPWVKVEKLDSLKELRTFAEYSRRFGSGRHDIGEATVLAWAEVHNATAFTDDEVAVQVGRERGVHVVRTLALVAEGVKSSILSEITASQLIDDLIRGGGRFPFGSGEFMVWAQSHGLLG